MRCNDGIAITQFPTLAGHSLATQVAARRIAEQRGTGGDLAARDQRLDFAVVQPSRAGGTRQAIEARTAPW